VVSETGIRPVPLGLRIRTTTGTNVVWHVYEGSQCAADLGPDGKPLRSYTWGPGVDNLLALSVHEASGATNTYYAATDALGCVRVLFNSAGAFVETCLYDPWGATTVLSNSQVIASSTYGNRFLFQGREYSAATGLYFFRAHWYAPELGRWLSPDPIGLEGGLNLYEFCANNPVSFRDPFGLYTTWDWYSQIIAVVSGTAQIIGGAAIAGTTGVTVVGAVAGGVLMINGGASVGAGIGNLIQMARGIEPSLNNSGYVGLVTSIITCDPTKNAYASTFDLASNGLAGGIGSSAMRSAFANAFRDGTFTRGVYNYNSFGTFGSLNQMLSEDEIATLATRASLADVAVTAAGIIGTTTDTFVNLRKNR